MMGLAGSARCHAVQRDSQQELLVKSSTLVRFRTGPPDGGIILLKLSECGFSSDPPIGDFATGD